jgi:hypothetical protein
MHPQWIKRRARSNRVRWSRSLNLRSAASVECHTGFGSARMAFQLCFLTSQVFLPIKLLTTPLVGARLQMNHVLQLLREHQL